MDSLGKLKFPISFYTKNRYSAYGLPKLSINFFLKFPGRTGQNVSSHRINFYFSTRINIFEYVLF